MSRVRVAIVDDDGDTRETVRMVLVDAGYAVEEAATGVDGLRLLQYAAEGMVVLLDERLPDIRGLGILDMLEFYPTMQRHRYLSFTASPNAYTPQELARLAQLGVSIVAKPFNIDDLVRAVDENAAKLA